VQSTIISRPAPIVSLTAPPGAPNIPALEVFVTTGVKIAIGCGVALILGIMAVAVAVFSGAYWLKGKAEQVTGNERRIEQLHEKANAAPFDRPADGVIQEDRLVKFIDIRKRVFTVYEKHRAALEAMGQKKQGDWGDVTKGFSVINEIRVAQAQALADVGMSEDEYRFMVEQVYKTAWAAEVAKATGGKSVSDAAADAYAKAAEAMEQARAGTQQGRAAAEQARRQTGAPGTDAAVEDTKEAEESVEEGIRDLRKQAEQARESARDMDVPPANIELFRKYEAEIKKYAMAGLEWIGL